jgi:hypothetical protein
MERLISLWLYTLGNYIFQMERVPRAISDANMVVPHKIMNSTMLTITKKELRHFHSVNDFTYSYTNFFAGLPNKRAKLMSREARKSKSLSKVNSEQAIKRPRTVPVLELLPTAIKVLEEDYTLLGTTENLPSLFVYLSCRYGVNISATCDKYITRNTIRRNSAYFGSVDRPPAETLFNAESFLYLKEITHSDNVLWQIAQQKHEQQLAEYGYTLKSATEAWHQHCDGGFTKKTKSSLGQVMQ